ncbi:TetR/AcrR family transcriptional regulator [Sphaerisporangium fuscum]|uniref:TetR/AcrR family transcriptional regulator n=1 Tax=Sphaerisporangium fuscum TaxID=2835868 RepID=UPI001BDD47B1|nr:TetR/AcrR family transcriptional regulator [Sphaerisporangium fuscum]
MDAQTATTRLLDAAAELFYGRGIQAVGMDEIRSASGVSLKRLYQLFPSKESLVDAYLRRRDIRWRESLEGHADAQATPRERILAVFDWLHDWFGEADFRGCGFINSFGELGATSPAVAEIARVHKDAFRRYIGRLVTAAGGEPSLADQLALLAEGAMTTAAIHGSSDPAHQAKDAARVLLDAAGVKG